MVAGIWLFAPVKQRMGEGIRSQLPDVDEVEVQRILEHRLRVARYIENSPWTN